MVLFGKDLVTFRGDIKITFLKFNVFLKKGHSTKVTFSYLEQMIVLVNRFLLRKKFTGMAIWPFIILRTKKLKEDKVFLNHERIHLRQQIEMLVVLFYIWYILEFLIRLVQYKNRFKAYRNISFEREAYGKEKDLNYLKKRPFWRFVGFV